MSISHALTRQALKIKPNLFESIIFGLMMSGPPKLRSRDATASLSGSVDSSILFSAMIWGLGALWMLHYFNGYALFNKRLPKFGGIHKWAVLYGGTLVLSILVSDAVFLTFYRGMQVILVVIFTEFWVRKFGVVSTFRHMVGTCVVLGLCIVLAMFVAPDLVYFGGENRVRGDLIANPGSLAAVTLAIIFSVRTVIQNRYVFISIVALFIFLLIVAQTRTYYGIIAFFFVLSFIRVPQSGRLRIAQYLIVLLIPLIIMVGAAAAISEFVVRDEKSLATLSSRTPLWEYTVAQTLEQAPFTGVGFQANRAILLEFNDRLGNSHNAYLEILSGGGLISFGAYLIFLIPIVIYAIRLFISQGSRPEIFATVSLLFMMLIAGFTSQALIVPSVESWTFWMCVALLPRFNERMVRERELSRVQTLYQGAPA